MICSTRGTWPWRLSSAALCSDSATSWGGWFRRFWAAEILPPPRPRPRPRSRPRDRKWDRGRGGERAGMCRVQRQINMETEKKGKTLWEMLQDRLHGSGGGNGTGIAFENPLDLRVG